MKTKIFLSLLITAALFTSCSTENDAESIDQGLSLSDYHFNPNNSAIAKSNVTEGKWTTWYDNGGSDYGCKDKAKDCMPPVVVISNNVLTLEDVKDYINPDVLDAYNNEELTLDIRHNDSEKIDYFIFKDKKSVKLAHQFSRN